MSDVTLLKLEYDLVFREVEDYEADHNIQDFFIDADETYCKLLIKRKKAYAEYMKAKVGIDWYNKMYAEVVNHMISIYNEKIRYLKWNSRRMD